jgi:hypothetical protein
MNLNKTQIDALSDKFYNEITSKNEESNKLKRDKQLEKFRPNYLKGIKLLKDNSWLSSIDINISKSESVTLNSEESFEDYTSSWEFNSLIKDIDSEISKSDIKNDIILATIDSTSVEEIMNSLNKKYK